MEIDTKSFPSCDNADMPVEDVIIEEKFIPDVDHEPQINDHDVPNVNLDQINQKNHQNPDLNSTENNEKSRNLHIFNGQLYKCKCNKRYQNYKMFKKHEKTCQFQNSNLIVCRVFRCHATFTNQNDFEVHKLKRHSKPRTKNLTKIKSKDTIGHFPCDYKGCTSKFPTKIRLNHHTMEVHVPRNFACLYCNHKFKTKNHKLKHEKRVHLKKSPKIDKNLEKSQEFQVENEPKIKTEVEKIENNETYDQNVSLNDIKLGKSDKYSCYLCHKSFTRKINAKNHEKICQNMKKSKKDKIKSKIESLGIKCEYEDCDKVFSNISRYNIHIDVVHLELPKYRSQRSNTLSTRKKGINTDMIFNRKSCIFCGKVFKLRGDVIEHMKLPHTINCSKCPRNFVDPVQLERHTRKNHLEELKEFQCTKCPRKYLKEAEVKKHNREVHARKMTICPICSNEVPLYKFTRHLRQHKGNRCWNSLCTICHVYLANKEMLEKHYGTQLHLEKGAEKEEFILPHDHDLNIVDSILIKKTTKSEEGLYDPAAENAKKTVKSQVCACPTCGLKFKNFHHREAHRVKFHGYEKPRCELCDMNFSSKSNLTSHIQNSMMHKLKEKELQT